MSLRLNRSDPIFRTIRELPSIGGRCRTRDDIRLGRNLPINFMMVRQKRDQIFVFRTLPSVKLNFHLLTENPKKNYFQKPFHGAKPISCTITIDKNNTCCFPLISCKLDNIY